MRSFCLNFTLKLLVFSSLGRVQNLPSTEKEGLGEAGKQICASHLFLSVFFFFFKLNLILFKIFVYFYFSVALGLCCGEQAFSRCGEQGLLSSCSEQASPCGGFSSGEAWPLDA